MEKILVELDTVYTKYRMFSKINTKCHLLKKINQLEESFLMLKFSDNSINVIKTLFETIHIFTRIRILFLLSHLPEKNQTLQILLWQELLKTSSSQNAKKYNISFLFSALMYSNLPFLENSLIENQEYFLSLHYKSEFLLLLSSIATTNDSLSLFFSNFHKYHDECFWGIGNLASHQGELFIKRSLFKDILITFERYLSPKKGKIPNSIYYALAQICITDEGIDPQRLNHISHKLFLIKDFNNPLYNICRKRVNNISLNHFELLYLESVSKNFPLLGRKVLPSP